MKKTDIFFYLAVACAIIALALLGLAAAERLGFYHQEPQESELHSAYAESMCGPDGYLKPEYIPKPYSVEDQAGRASWNPCKIPANATILNRSLSVYGKSAGVPL
jgi:hypothetical protein